MKQQRVAVTLDPDVAKHLEAFARDHNLLLSAALNGVVRAGLKAEAEREQRADQQRHFFETLEEQVDIDVLASDDMWRRSR
jgi:hypothetical protein